MGFFAAENVTISFGGLKALQQVSFKIDRGQVFSIIGPNGAGKTTIFNCISRIYDLDKGTLSFMDRDITHERPHRIAIHGIARTFQNIELFRNMTVIDNILMGRHRRRKTNLFSELVFMPSVRRQERENRRKAEELIEFLDLQANRDELISSLAYGVQKKVELGRALAMEPELLLLDEPSSGLNLEETEELGYWIEDIKEGKGITIALVEHNMRFVQQVSDTVLALDFGQVITQGRPREVLNHPEVMRAYLGEKDVLA